MKKTLMETFQQLQATKLEGVKHVSLTSQNIAQVGLLDMQVQAKTPITLEPCKEGSALMKTMEEIFQNISMQMLETKYILDLGHLIKIVLDLKWYL